MTSTSYSHHPHRPHRHLEDVHEDSFRVHYRINALSKSEALSIVDELRYEQTVELPEQLVPRESWIGRNVVGQINALEEESEGVEGGEGKGAKSDGAVGKDDEGLAPTYSLELHQRVDDGLPHGRAAVGLQAADAPFEAP